MAGKTTIRGIAKAFIRSNEREKAAVVAALESKILGTECRAGQESSSTVARQLEIDRASLKQLLLEEARQYWRASTQKVYDQDDKNGKLLYWLATHGQSATIIPA